ncbi:MAG: hypothetical protein ACI4QL_05020 [Candidatus Fimimonas sp.]
MEKETALPTKNALRQTRGNAQQKTVENTVAKKNVFVYNNVKWEVWRACVAATSTNAVVQVKVENVFFVFASTPNFLQ